MVSFTRHYQSFVIYCETHKGFTALFSIVSGFLLGLFLLHYASVDFSNPDLPAWVSFVPAMGILVGWMMSALLIVILPANMVIKRQTWAKQE